MVQFFESAELILYGAVGALLVVIALIDNLSELTLDVQNISDEAELTKRIADAIRTK